MPRSWCRRRNGPIWMDDANLNAAPADLKLTFLNQRRIFADIAKQVTQFQPGKEVAPGIVTLPAPGHTPGHTVFAIHSGDQSLLVLSDTAQHPAVFARHPDWQAAFDIDGAGGGGDAQENLRSRRRRPHAGHRLSLPVPGLRPPDQDRERLRACSDRMAAEFCNAAQFSFAPALTKLARHRRAKPHSVLRYSTSCQRCSSVILSVP